MSVTSRTRIIARIESHVCAGSTDMGMAERHHYVSGGACAYCDLSIHALARLHAIPYVRMDESCLCHA